LDSAGEPDADAAVGHCDGMAAEAGRVGVVCCVGIFFIPYVCEMVANLQLTGPQRVWSGSGS
jgi:hypothetical protein